MLQSPRRTARSAPPTLERTRARRPGVRTKIGALLFVAVIAVLAVALNRSPSGPPAHISPEVRSAPYTAYSACLLTESTGLRDSTAAATWDGMQAAARQTHAQISYLPMQGPATTANAGIYINTLALRGCSLVLAAGSVPASGAQGRAAAWPRLPLVAVLPAGPDSRPGSQPSAARTNVTVIRGTSATALATQIEALLADASRTAPTIAP